MKLVADQSLGRRGQTDTDWLKSLKVVSRALAILWSQTPIGIRQTILARAEQEYRETQET
jgi:hypothetical protein